jgi:hypothetical protein
MLRRASQDGPGYVRFDETGPWSWHSGCWGKPRLDTSPPAWTGSCGQAKSAKETIDVRVPFARAGVFRYGGG